jgi:hypothetical protein
MIQNDEDQRKEKIQMVILAFVAGMIQHYLFYDREVGISYPIFVGVFYGYVFWGLRHKVRRGLDLEFMLLVPIILLSLTFFLFANSFLHGINALILPLLIVAQTMRMGEVKRQLSQPFHYLGDVIKQMTAHGFLYFPLPFHMICNSLRLQSVKSKNKTLMKISLGLLLTLPLLFIVIPLLSSADSIFQQKISGIQQLVFEINVGSFLFRSIWVVLVSLYLFSYVWSILYPRVKKEIQVSDVDWSSPQPVQAKRISLDITVALTVFVVVNAVYLLFTIVQFSYFFASGDGVLPDGTYYAEYARRGFAELILVAMINFSLLFAGIHGVKADARGMKLFLKIMLTLLVSSTIVMLISSHLRLSLYEEAYGYTTTRILVHAFMIFLGVLLCLSLVRVWNDRLPLLKQFLIVSLASGVLINYVNIDVMIAKNNLQRYTHSGKIDMAYLSSLSYDIIPELVHYYENTSHTPDGLKELLLDKKLELAHDNKEWQGFNLAKYNATEALRNVK